MKPKCLDDIILLLENRSFSRGRNQAIKTITGKIIEIDQEAGGTTTGQVIEVEITPNYNRRGNTRPYHRQKPTMDI